jgi:hypothetical protein
MKQMTQLVEDLKATKALIANEADWGKGAYEWNGCLCTVGALRRALKVNAIDVVQTSAYQALRAALGGELPLVTFNDRDTTTHADIMALFDRAIAAQSEGEAP